MTNEKTPDSAASALSAGLGVWLPIETAPKDGTHVLIKPKKYGYMNGNQQSPPCVAHWFVDPDLGGYWVISVSNIDIPGFWMPLPEAPNVKVSGLPQPDGD